MDVESKAYEQGYEKGFIDGMQKNAESKVTKFIDQGMRKPLTKEQMSECSYDAEGFMIEREAAMRNVELAHGIGEKE